MKMTMASIFNLVTILYQSRVVHILGEVVNKKPQKPQIIHLLKLVINHNQNAHGCNQHVMDELLFEQIKKHEKVVGSALHLDEQLINMKVTMASIFKFGNHLVPIACCSYPRRSG